MRKMVLVVEDQDDNRRIVRDLLINNGFDVVEATNGLKGVELAQAHHPDLILMDIQIPGIDGYEATRRIKSDPKLRDIPLIVVTSYALDGDDKKAFEAGCDAYVAKPYSPRKLLAQIQSFLQ